MKYRWLRNPAVVILTPLMLTLVLLVACGGDATATPRPPAAPAAVDTEALRSLVQDAVREATAGAQPAVSEQELARLVEQAVVASVPEGASLAEIQSLVEDAVAAAAAPGVTSDQIEGLVSRAISEAVAAFPTPVPTATVVPTPTPPVAMPVTNRVIIATFTEEEGNDPGQVVSAFWG